MVLRKPRRKENAKGEQIVWILEISVAFLQAVIHVIRLLWNILLRNALFRKSSSVVLPPIEMSQLRNSIAYADTRFGSPVAVPRVWTIWTSSFSHSNRLFDTSLFPFLWRCRIGRWETGRKWRGDAYGIQCYFHLEIDSNRRVSMWAGVRSQYKP
jgi:hypothetical protein